MTGAAIKSRLWERLLAHPDELTDLRIIFAEWVNTKAKLDAVRDKKYPGPPPLHEAFETFEERKIYMQAMKDAQQWRARKAALQETFDSLCEQLRIMADGLNPEDLDTFMSEHQWGGT